MARRDATGLVAVHRELRRRGTATLPALERFFGASRQSINNRFQRLAQLGAAEKATGLHRDGAEVWRVPRDLAFVLAVSVKRDRVAAQLLDMAYLPVGEVVEEKVPLVDLVEAKELVEKVGSAAARALASAQRADRPDPLQCAEPLDIPSRTLGVAVALPTPVYRVRARRSTEATWKIRTASRWIMPNLRRDGFDLHDDLREELRRRKLPDDPLVLINDASAAALGTVVDLRMQGSKRSPRDMALVWLAEGVGGGVISGHRLVTGNAGFAAEIGHLAVRSDGLLCRHCGVRGCLETVASTNAINREVMAAFDEADGPEFGWSGEPRLVVDTGSGVRRHPAYTEAMREAGWWTGIALAQVVNLFNPQLIVLTDPYPPDLAIAEIEGPAPVRDEQFQRSTEAALRRNSLDPAYRHVMGTYGDHQIYGLQFGVHSDSPHGIDVTHERAPMLEMVGAAADLVDTFSVDVFGKRVSASHAFAPYRP